MTLSDCKAGSAGKVAAVRGDVDTHRRLVDMGILDGEYLVRAVRGGAWLVEFLGEFSVVAAKPIATQIEVTRHNENRVVRKP